NELLGRLAQAEAALQRVAVGTGEGEVSRLKIPEPDKFDGNRTKLRAYLTQMKEYLSHYPQLKTGADQVRHAARYLTGPALDWFEPTLRDFLENYYTEQSEFTKVVFAKYENFEYAIKGAFGEPDEDKAMQNRLHS